MESFSDNTTYQLVTVVFGIENVLKYLFTHIPKSVDLGNKNSSNYKEVFRYYRQRRFFVFFFAKQAMKRPV